MVQRGEAVAGRMLGIRVPSRWLMRKRHPRGAWVRWNVQLHFPAFVLRAVVQLPCR